MAAALRKLGFRVLEGSDLDKQAMDAKVREFGAALAGAEQGVFFYAATGCRSVDRKAVLVERGALLAH